MRQLRIKMMNASAAVTPMAMMTATAKSMYPVGRIFVVWDIWFSLTLVWPPGHKHHGTEMIEEPLAAISLNLLRLNVKYFLERGRLLCRLVTGGMQAAHNQG
jgi:hypothetical protein